MGNSEDAPSKNHVLGALQKEQYAEKGDSTPASGNLLQICHHPL